MSRGLRFAGLLAALLIALCANAGTAAAVPCDPGDNEVVCENKQPGSPPSEWDITGAGDPSIQGYATDISVDQGQTVGFKVDTPSSNYRLEIYRLGYYDGDGARLIATVDPSAALPQAQPACLGDAPSGLIDCGNWAPSASWAVPPTAVSGVYIAKLVREDPEDGRASHVVFIVRDDDGGSELLLQTDDTTWQAYNSYGGNSLYAGAPAGRAYKVSYNRPFNSRAATPEDWVFNASYPMLRWIERNGYDVSYFTGVDSHRLGAELPEHDTFISVGHDEYWSAGQRNNVTNARNAGVDLAFFSGNEVFWKTRWEASIDASATPNRTLVSYKETHAGAKIDPAPEWTGTWRDNRVFNPEGPNPENGLTGTMFKVNSGTSEIEVPEADGNMRLWRNTGPAGLAAGQTEDLSANTLGYEWDEAPDNSSRPPGLVYNSSTTRSGVEVLQDNGSTYAPGTATHHLTTYLDANGAGAGDDALVFGAGTIQWAWGLDGVHDRGASTPDPDMQQATVNLFADMGVQPSTLQAGLVPATASSDATAPSSLITSPGNGDDLESGQSTTISGTSIDAGGGVVGAVEVSTDGGASWHPAEGRESWSYSWTPGPVGSATIITRATDDSGNIESSGAGVTVDVVPGSCPCSIWSDSFTGPGSGDPNAVELGVKFRSDDAGFITGLRFYKTPGNGGTHVGRLWTAGGAELATATFTGETATGWQEVTFGAPVAIDPGTTYIASYHAPNGNYAAINGYFASGGFDSVPLHALGNGVDGANGVYRYGAGGVFPTDTFESSNYLVDVVFENDVGPDTTPPTITARTPAGGASGVASATDVTATFNEPMDAGTINGATVELRDPGNALVPATVTYNPANRRVTLDPDANLQSSTAYTAKVKGGPGGVSDDAAPGNPLAADSIWSFTTAAPPPPPPDEGPGGPILVISDSTNPFGRYYAEILRSEGLNEFTVTDRSLVTPAVLSAHDVVVLGETGLSPAQVTLLDTWVNAGGNLIAMRPDPQLAGLLGLTDTPGTLADAYLQVDTGTGPGTGIVGQTMQFHSTADQYTPNGAQTIATLYSDAATSTPNPAVTLKDVGSNGGQAAAFTYDLARSVVYTRQGNPAWAGQNRDASIVSGPTRPNDLFFGADPGDPQPDWIDLSKVAIPQADEQQRLLANLIGEMNQDRKALPRFWYFPRDEKAVVVMTGDDHASGGTAGRFEQYKASSPAGCSVADWECIRSSSYIYANAPLTDAQAAGYHAEGFDIGLHPDTGCSDFTPASLDQVFDTQLATFGFKYTSIPAPSTNRTHCVAWSDWVTHAKVELDHGIRFDTNYYYYPPSWIQDRPGMMTGSGMPQRFADLDGTMVDAYQGATQMTDESGQSYPFTADSLLNKAIGAEGYYGAFVANMHTDSPTSAGSDAIVASAQARGVPIVSSRQMLEWLDGRNGSSFENVTQNEAGTKLNFEIAVGAGANGLRAMVPTTSEAGALTGIERNGVPITTTPQTIKGVQYTFFDAAAGSYEATFAIDDAAPLISNVNHVVSSNGIATITWDTNEASDSLVQYGTTPALGSSQSSAAPVTSHSVQLTGLDPNQTYHYRVTSADGFANSRTEPEPPAAPASFVTPSASLIDTTSGDFSAGTTGPDTYVSETANGEVILKPTVGEEFSGAGIPAGWSSNDWSGSGGGAGGTATVSGGSLHLNGAFAGTTATYGPGRAMESVATFNAAEFQHVGFGVDFNNSPNFAMFSTHNTTNEIRTRTNFGGGETFFTIPGSAALIGSPHRYRVEWIDADPLDQVRFYVDGALVRTENGNFAADMRPAASDFRSPAGSPNGAPELSVDWIRMSPYPSTGTFESRVLDAGQQVSWNTLNWSVDTPPNTAVALSYRTGNTAVPDGSWTSFAPVGSPGSPIAGNSRYIQYRAQHASAEAMTTPTLSQVEATYTAGPDVTPPTVAGRSPAPNATGVPTTTNVQAQFSEAMNGSTIDETSFRLRSQGGGSEIAADVTYSSATATLDPVASLAPSTTYEVTVDGDVEDTSGNPLGVDDTWLFTTASSTTFSLTDTLVSDFNAGTTGPDTYVSETANGEVLLNPAVGAEFSGGPGLPAGWSQAPWTGGVATVSGGDLHVNGAYASTAATFGPGHALEFVATFGAETFQHAGFSDNFENIFAIFSTNSSTSQLQARTSFGGNTDVGSPGQYVGSSHRYRIEWVAGEVRFYIDGALVGAPHPGSFGPPGVMRPIASDFTNAAPELTVDWMRMSPYPASGSFSSRILDAGSSVDWDGLSWSEDTPAGTDIALSVRTGDSPTPDPSWTVFTPVPSSGGAIPGNSRYLQYKADLTTASADLTPALSEVTIAYGESFPAPAAPTITDTDPDSPANDNDPEVKGTVGAGDPTQVKIYANGTCAQPPAATGSVAQFIGGGITVPVPPDTTTTLSATVSNSGGDSACSNAFDYTDDSISPASPTITDSDPDSPSGEDNPNIKGTAEALSTVSLYKAPTPADCTPANLAATGSAGAFASPGLPVLVADAQTTTLRATATDATGNVSACSAPFDYVEDDPPVAVDDAVTVAENAPAAAIAVLANDTDADDGPKSIASATDPANGTVVITGGGSGLTYAPDPGYCNSGPPPGPTDDFTYTLSPGGDTATVAVRVDCAADPAGPAADFNGDGFADRAVGVPLEDVGSVSDAGVVNVIYGSATGLTDAGNQVWNQSDLGGGETAEAGDQFGRALTTGDFNQDGFADLAVGAPFENVGSAADAGTVNVIYGSASGLTSAGNQLWHQNSPGIPEAADAGDSLGGALASGDLNGDAVDDLAIGVPSETVGTTAGAGAVNTIYGSASGLTSAGSQIWNQNSAAIAEASEAGDLFGAAVAAGDLNGDARDDLAIGAPSESVGSTADAGSVNVIYGSGSGLSGTGNQLWHQNQPSILELGDAGDAFGAALASGDLNGDARDDLAIGVPSETVGTTPAGAGAVNTIYGSASGLTSAGNQLWHQNSPGIPEAADAGDSLGGALASGDLNGDAVDDLAIGVPSETVGTTAGAGAVNTIYGSASGLTSAGSQIWNQNSAAIAEASEAGDLFGAAVAAGDLNGDARDDLAIGVPLESVGTVAGAGAMNVIYGSGSGLFSTGNQLWSQDSPNILEAGEASDRFGAALGAGAR